MRVIYFKKAGKPIPSSVKKHLKHLNSVTVFLVSVTSKRLYYCWGQSKTDFFCSLEQHLTNWWIHCQIQSMIELHCTDWWVFIHCRAKKSSRLRSSSKLHLSIAHAAAGDQSPGKHLLLCSIGSRMKCLQHREVPLDFLLPNPLQLNLPECEVQENSYRVCIHLPFFLQDSLLSFCPFQKCHLLSMLR